MVTSDVRPKKNATDEGKVVLKAKYITYIEKVRW